MCTFFFFAHPLCRWLDDMLNNTFTSLFYEKSVNVFGLKLLSTSIYSSCWILLALTIVSWIRRFAAYAPVPSLIYFFWVLTAKRPISSVMKKRKCMRRLDIIQYLVAFTGYSFWDRLGNFLLKFTWIVFSVHKLNKLGKLW